MRIPFRYVAAYSATLNAVSDRARAQMERRLMELDWSRDVATVRDELIAIMQAGCGASTDMAARLAAEFYDGLRAEFGIDDGFQAIVDSCREPEATEGAIRAFVQDVVDGKGEQPVIRNCMNRVDQEIRLAANKCVERNARRDPKRPRWARIPTGQETCRFCIMLASRGFVYHSEDTASHAHANCDCRVVPSWDKDSAEAEGYDPNLYFDMWKHPENYPPAATQRDHRGTATWMDALQVSASERSEGLPSGHSGNTLHAVQCDVYTTDDGIELVFPQGMSLSDQAMTPQRAIELLNRVPSEIRDHMQRKIFFVDYENPMDPYWRRRYRRFTRSYATGGDEITFYKSASHDDDYVVRTYCHEAGHFIDSQNGDISNTRQWIDAMAADQRASGMLSPTRYGQNSNKEDFAESVACWATDRAAFELEFSHRASIVSSLVT